MTRGIPNHDDRDGRIPASRERRRHPRVWDFVVWRDAVWGVSIVNGVLWRSVVWCGLGMVLCGMGSCTLYCLWCRNWRP